LAAVRGGVPGRSNIFRRRDFYSLEGRKEQISVRSGAGDGSHERTRANSADRIAGYSIGAPADGTNKTFGQ